MKFWWVNHKQTFRQEFFGKYMWSPKRNKNGHTNPFYETMRVVSPGEIVFSYAKGVLQGFGMAALYLGSTMSGRTTRGRRSEVGGRISDIRLLTSDFYLPMQSKPVAEAVEQGAYDQFRRRVLALDTTHIPRTAGGGESVSVHRIILQEKTEITEISSDKTQFPPLPPVQNLSSLRSLRLTKSCSSCSSCSSCLPASLRLCVELPRRF